MSSIIEGYTNDIFISYRQKDNKGDRWVSEFVTALKTELEATFKEDISIYFDENPHDGLLATYDVDASLKEKLKCLVFMPIISRTYCDPKSFAWEHEFKAFIDQASQDKFGLKIKLPNGNVASRIIPVRIRDLDMPDIKLCESILGGVIRGVDFVYKEPGVNRPLTPEDDEAKNLNNTRYRNQINKTANAIKEIISGLKPEPVTPVEDKKLNGESSEEVKAAIKQKESIVAGLLSQRSIKRLVMLLLVILCVIGAFAIYKIIRPASPRKSISVFISAGVSSDDELINIGEIFTEEIQRKLRIVKSLTVRSMITFLKNIDAKESFNTIQKKSDAKYMLLGIVRRSGNDITIWIELTSGKTQKLLWNDKYTWDPNLISRSTTVIVNEVARSVKVKLSPEEIKLIGTELTKNAKANISYIQATTASLNAWTSFTMANKYMESTSFVSAIEAYDEAIKEDSLFARAYAQRASARAWAYYTKQVDSSHFEKCRADIKKALDLDQDLPDAQIALGFYYYYCKKELDKALEYFTVASEMLPEDYQPLFYIAMVHRRKGEWKKSMGVIKRIITLDPQEALYFTNIGLTYTYFHIYDSALIYHQKAIDVMPLWTAPYKNMIETLIMRNGNTADARILVDSAMQKTGDNFTEFKILLDIYDRNYADALQEAEKSTSADFDYRGNKYLYLGEINRFLNNNKIAGIYYDSALVSFKNELVRNEDNHELHSYIGIANTARDKEKAIEEGNKAVDLIKYNNFDKSDMILNLAKIYTKVGEYNQAISRIDYLINNPSVFTVKLLQLDPVWEPLYDQPEYKSLLRKYLRN
jgi:tetratricopeptide (TPR) repeat protein